MSQKNFYDKMGFLFTDKDIERVVWKASEDNCIVLSVDLHQMTCKEARRFIRNIISLFGQSTITVELIHGYIHGTAIKEMILTQEISPRITEIQTLSYNPGVSVAKIACM